MPFSDLIDHCCATLSIPATDLAELVMQLYTQSPTELHTFQPPMLSHVEERPRATRLARYQARHCRVLSIQKHHMVQLAAPQTREVVARLDGARTVEDLVAELLPLIDDNTRAQLDDPEAALTANARLILERMAAEGVLVPKGAE